MTVSAEQFYSFEQQNSLFDISFDSVPIWERIRFQVWRDINTRHGIGQAHTGINKTPKDYIKAGILFTQNIIFKNPYLADESDILFLGHQRRKKETDGLWWDLYLDPIHQHCEYDYTHFESDYLLKHRTPAKTNNLRYLDIINYGNTIQKMLGLNGASLSVSEKSRLKQLKESLNREFNIDINLIELVTRDLDHRRRTLWLYRKLLSIVDPRLVVIIVGYGNETFIEACKEQNIPVVEIQHGAIHDRHMGYSFPEQRTKEMFPDYLLVWGEYWKETVEYPIPDCRVLPVGYPYLEQTGKKYESTQSKNQLLFISQGTIGKQLSKFALKVDQHPEIKHDVVYKLHPGEYDRWQDEYPWLIDANFDIIDTSETPLYELFSRSSAQIGVGSTAVYEGLCFNLETFVYDCPESSILNSLVEKGTAKLISSIDELAVSLGTQEVAFNRDYYFKPDAVRNTCRKIKQLANYTLKKT